MDSSFVWILMFAGAAVAFLGVILIASERELKSKRQQIEELLGKLKQAPQGAAVGVIAPQAEAGPQVAELQTQNRDLSSQLQVLSGKLELSQRALDELRTERENHAAESSTMNELRATNEQLQAQVDELRGRLAASEEQFQSAAARQPDSHADDAHLQAELAELRQAREANQNKIRELEAAQRNLPDVDAIEAGHRRERQTLQERIAELEGRLIADQALVSETQTLRQSLIGAEESQRALREAIRRHEEEIPRWQARIAEGVEHQRRFASLRAPFEELVSKQATLSEQQRRLQEELSAFARLMATSTDASQSSAGAPAPESGTGPVSGEPATADGQAEPKRARRFGIFGMLILLFATGLVAFQFLGSNSAELPAPSATAGIENPGSQAELTRAPSIPPAQTRATPEDTAARPEAPVEQALAKPVVQESTERSARSRQSAKPVEPRIAGTFQITRPSRVYAAPTELSRAIGDIEPGVKVNVVNARDGWLEIHSKRGRPPGYIRSEVAAPVTGGN